MSQNLKKRKHGVLQFWKDFRIIRQVLIVSIAPRPPAPSHPGWRGTASWAHPPLHPVQGGRTAESGAVKRGQGTPKVAASQPRGAPALSDTAANVYIKLDAIYVSKQWRILFSGWSTHILPEWRTLKDITVCHSDCGWSKRWFVVQSEQEVTCGTQTWIWSVALLGLSVSRASPFYKGHTGCHWPSSH